MKAMKHLNNTTTKPLNQNKMEKDEIAEKVKQINK